MIKWLEKCILYMLQVLVQVFFRLPDFENSKRREKNIDNVVNPYFVWLFFYVDWQLVIFFMEKDSLKKDDSKEERILRREYSPYYEKLWKFVIYENGEDYENL